MTRLTIVMVAASLIAGCGQRDAARETAEPSRTEVPTPVRDSASAEVRRDSAAAMPAVARLQVPVTLHSAHEDHDACSWGAVQPWRGPAGDSVDVLSGPGAQYPVVDRLPTGHEFGLCDGKGEWAGVVYPPESASMDDCGPLGTPVREPLVYLGPCKSGWVLMEKVEVTAG